MQAVAADIDEAAGWSETSPLAPPADLLIKNAQCQQRCKRGNEGHVSMLRPHAKAQPR
jgi:hypothetical protein